MWAEAHTINLYLPCESIYFALDHPYLAIQIEYATRIQTFC